ncbi:unnamed protein product, partial [Effrenium voratum]
GSKIGSIQLTACLAEKAMEPIEWLIIGHQIYKGLKFGMKVQEAAAKDKAKAEAAARARQADLLDRAKHHQLDDVDLCNLLSDFLEVNFDSDRDGHLGQREILEGARRLKEAALETKDPQMRQCVVDYLSLLAWAFKVNKALELNMRETVRALQKYMEPGEECDPNRVQIELIVISFIRNPQSRSLAQKLGAVGGSRSGSGMGPETKKVLQEEVEDAVKEGVKDMCKDVAQEATSEVAKCFMENLPSLLLP